VVCAPFLDIGATAATIRLPRHASRGWSRVGTLLACTDLAVRDSFLLSFRDFEKPVA